MKPLKRPVFILVIVASCMSFLVLLGWWTLFVMSSFRHIAQTPPPNQNQEFNLDGYRQLIKKVGE